MISLIANYRPQVKLNLPTYIVRTLHGPGTFMVSKGEVISPDTILAKYQSPAGFSSIKLSDRLKVDKSEGQKFLQKPLGSRIYRGELLAEKKSLFGNAVVIAPTDGMLDSYNDQTGELRLKFFPREITLPSGVYGIVEEIDPKNAHAVIKTFVNEINGVIGSGRQRLGLIKVIPNPSNLTKPSHLTPDMVHNIVVAGAAIDRDGLVQAVTMGISGLIVGGINFRSFKPLVNKFDANVNMVTDVGMTVCVTDGFGPIPLSDQIFKLLSDHHDQIGYVTGDPPRILLPCATAESIPALQKIVLPKHTDRLQREEIEVKNINIGDKIRIIWPPFLGSIGTVIAIDASPTTLPSGLGTYLLTIEISSRKIRVPYPNVELV